MITVAHHCDVSYTLYTGRLTEAKKSMQFVTPNIPESELQAIREVALKAAESQRNTTLTDDWNRMTSPTVYPGTVYSLLFQSFNHYSLYRYLCYIFSFGSWRWFSIIPANYWSTKCFVLCRFDIHGYWTGYDCFNWCFGV